MEDLVFQNERQDASPGLAQTKLGQNASATNAFKEFSRSHKDGPSPPRKQTLGKKLDSLHGKPGQNRAAVTELSPQALGKNKDLQTAAKPLGDVKDLGVVGTKKRSEQANDSQSVINQNSQKEDSFQKLYSKELDLDEDEVPIILHELNDSAIHFISHEQYERSLSLLQKAQTLLDRLKFQKNPKDRFLIQVTMHNMALCFQKMGALEECALCLDACLHQINSQYLAPTFAKKPTKKLKKLKYECKIHMQVCALLSQLHRHEEALLHAKQAVQISQYLVNDLVSLCKLNVAKTLAAKKKEQQVHEEQERRKFENGGMSMSQTSSQADLIYYDHSISMLERTALRVYPIVKEIQTRMVKHKDLLGAADGPKSEQQTAEEAREDALVEKGPLNMKVLLGYLNQSEWLYLLNIGNIMQITPLTIHDLYSNQKIDVELSRDSILEKVTFLAISYFCVSTELRFLVSSKEKLSFDPVYVKAESEFWHGKALEISCGFLPSESPLVTHILSSYQKHHAPVQQSIPENAEDEQGLRVIRPEKGIDKSQFQPIIRTNKHLNIALSPLRLSPNNHRLQAKAKKAEVKDTGVTANLMPAQSQQAKSVRQKSGSRQHSGQSPFSAEEQALIVQAALHNPNKRSIEFSSNQTTLDKKNSKSSSVNEASDPQGVPLGGADIVEYELQSFDQSEVQAQAQAQTSSARPLSSQHIHPQRTTQQTPNPARQVDPHTKTQMAVPSPNALASAMQREQGTSLSQSSLHNPSQQIRTEAAKRVQTQRQPQKGAPSIFAHDKQSTSLQALPPSKNNLMVDQDLNNGQVESIDESELIQLATAGDLSSVADPTRQSHDRDRTRKHRPMAANFDDSRGDQKHFETQKPVSGTKKALNNRSGISNLQRESKGRSDEEANSEGDERNTRALAAQSSRQSQRSQSKGKQSKKKGVLTQPQTYQNSANTTSYEPIRQALQGTDISHFAAGDKKRIEVADQDLAGPKTRQAHSSKSYKNLVVPHSQAKGLGRVTTSSLEGRDTANVRPPSSGLPTSKAPQQHVNGERPDSRRHIGGKRRQIKEQGKPESSSNVRSSSAGRRNQNQILPTHGYKTNDQSMTSASSHVQFSMSGQHVGGVNQSKASSSNVKSFQSTRKAVTAHSTHASNSPRKGMPQSKFQEVSAAGSRLGKATQGVQDPVFMTTNQLNQSRSTIEPNNSTLVDRSLNEQLLLNNSSLDAGVQPRSRSFAKTGALSQQNSHSREVIVGQKKKNLGSHPSQQTMPASKSQTKQKANKEMLNYLNQGTAAHKNMHTLASGQLNTSKYSSSGGATSNLGSQKPPAQEVDYRKQLLIKQALDVQKQSKDSRTKSGPKGVSSRNQVGFQTHTNSVQVAVSHSSSVQQLNKQSHSSQGLRKSSHGIARDQGAANQSQKVIQSQQQIAQMDPSAIAAIQQVLSLKQGGQTGSQQNAQAIYNQILQLQHQAAAAQTGQGHPPGVGKKQSQHTHTMIKKFLKERSTPQPAQIPQSQSSALLGSQSLMAGSHARNGQSQSPTPGGQASASSSALQKHSNTLIDNFTQAPFLASSSHLVPASKQAHTTKASAEASAKVRSFNPQKIYAQKQQTVKAQANSYFTEQPPSQAKPRASAQDRFTEKKGASGEPGQREPTPVFHHKPYVKPSEDPLTVDSQAQYPMQPGKSTAKQQLAAMYKSLKSDAKQL